MTAMDVILGLLHKRPFTGYEIRHTFQTLFAFFFDAGYGTIYPTLSKMEKLGYISKKAVPQENRPQKNVYSLTDKGREQFESYLESPLEKETYKSDFLVRLYFGELAGAASVRTWIGSQLGDARSRLEKLTAMKARSWERMSAAQQICLSMGIEQLCTSIRVLEEGLTKLEGSRA